MCAHLRCSTLLLGALAATVAVVATPPAIHGQEQGQEQSQAPAGDVVELTLEQILETALVPTGIMGSHVHQKGEWMLDYNYQSMDMDGNRDQSHRLATAEVLELFPVTPLRMTTETQIFELMYGATDRISLMAKVPFHQQEMDHVTRAGVEFTTASEGVGDVELMTHFVLARRGAHWWVGGLSVGLPTGSIEERDDLPTGPNLGGVVEIRPGLSRLVFEVNTAAAGQAVLTLADKLTRLASKVITE